MESRHGDNDGSDIFWPGYVDAVTNLVLNLLFLLTIMTVAVFMFALELGRAGKGVAPGKPPEISAKPEAGAVAKTAAAQAEENIALKREIQRLNQQLAQRIPAPGLHPAQSGLSRAAAQPGKAVALAQAGQPAAPVQPGPPGQAATPAPSGTLVQSGAVGKPGAAQQPGDLIKTIDVTSSVPQPLTGLDKALVGDAEVVVRFTDEAVAFTPAEHERLLDTLRPIVARGKAGINVVVPAGFSEAKRMGFYRAMAVRNLLMEMKMPSDKIEVAVVEGRNNANASLVRVK